MAKYLILTVIWLFSVDFHPIHISVCEIDFDRERKALEITQRIFIDDLELELANELNTGVLNFMSLSKEKRNEHLKAYLKRHVALKLDNKSVEFEYLGHEMETDAVFCYYQVTKVKRLNQIEVKNSVLLNTYNDQINIVHISEKDKVRSMRLDRKTPSDELNFED